MRSFIAVTAAPGKVVPVSSAALACLTDPDTVVERVDVDSGGWVAFAGGDQQDMLGVPGGPFTVPLSLLRRTREGDVATSDLGGLIVEGAGLTRMLPPFAAAHRGDGQVTVANDWLGYRQLFWWQGPDAAAVSTSARALAELSGKGFDAAGLGALAMIGWLTGDQTIFEGVRALPPASIATLQSGSIDIRPYAEPLDHHRSAPRLDDAVEEMAQILVAWQTNYLAAHPDAVLQLTGGHDSRILLGAIPRTSRHGLQAMTVGTDRHPDVVIAADLARRYGMRHAVYSLTDVVPTASEAHALALGAARALEYQASPLALAPLMLVESRIRQGHRLSGLGGEVARGFYYAGQPTDGQTSARLVERLARWRIFANEAVEPAALSPDFYADSVERTMTTLVDLFPAGSWLRATDSFYLYQRMHRWSAAHGTVAGVRRYAVNPMFDHRFIELALAVAPADKRDSMLLGRLMNRLDPELARIPLESGLVPANLGTRTLATRVRVGSVTARRAAGKIRQKIMHGRRPQLGAAEAAELVVAHWRESPSSCRPLYDQPAVNADWLDGLLAGTQSGAPTTVAFLVNLLAAAT